MKALSIKQPYAGLIMAGIKNVENRSWHPKITPGTMAIVSTATPDAARWWEPMRTRCAKMGVKFPEALCKHNGAIVGTVEFNYLCWMGDDGQPETDHPTFDDDSWWQRDYIGWILERPRRLVKPIPIKGQLGLYNLADDIVKQFIFMS